MHKVSPRDDTGPPSRDMHRYPGGIPAARQRMGHWSNGLQLHGHTHHRIHLRGVRKVQRDAGGASLWERAELRPLDGHFDVLQRHLRVGAQAQRYSLWDSEVKQFCPMKIIIINAQTPHYMFFIYYKLDFLQ